MKNYQILNEDKWQLGDWLPITWIPATPDEIEYMEFVREKVRKEHDKYLENLRISHGK